jgi:hypothetical protein
MITIPVEIGDIVYFGRFKNKRTIVKTIGKDEKGQPTINRRTILKFKIKEKEQVKENINNKNNLMTIKQKRELELYIAKRVQLLLKEQKSSKKSITESKSVPTDKKSLLTYINKEIKKLVKEHAAFGGYANTQAVGNIGMERAFNAMSDEEFDKCDDINEQEENGTDVDDIDDDFNMINKKRSLKKKSLKEQGEDNVEEEPQTSDKMLTKLSLQFKKENDLSSMEFSKFKDAISILLKHAKNNFSEKFIPIYKKLLVPDKSM